jgi:hypothetical protein
MAKIVKNKKKAVKKPAPRTTAEKLRGLVNLKRPGKTAAGATIAKPYYMQKELAAMLGVSTRTLRRFKNEKGHVLSSRTVARIKGAVSKRDRTIKKMLDSGFAFQSEIKTTRGKKRRQYSVSKDPGLKMPASRILQFPLIYSSKFETTIAVEVDGWSLDEKIALVESAYREKRFNSWHYRVRLPKGQRYIPGDLQSPGRFVAESEEGEEGEEAETTQYITSRPYSMKSGFRQIRPIMEKQENDGSVIVRVNFVGKRKKDKIEKAR